MKEFYKRFNRVFVTGDVHGDVLDLERRVKDIGDTTKQDLLIILGDCGFFYSVFFDREERDLIRRHYAASLPITILCVQGNHEQPFKEMKAKSIKLLGGEGYFADDIYFAANGTTLDINGKKALVVGGAYSVDKKWRLARHEGWWENEELSEKELDKICDEVYGKQFDFVFSHTCPYKNLPREVFLPEIDQTEVSHRTELYLQKIHDTIDFKEWYCAHFHTEKQDGKIEFFYNSTKQII